MPLSNIFIFGASGHARVVIDIVEKQGAFRIVGLLDSYKEHGLVFCDHRVLGAEADLPALVNLHGATGVIVAIGDNFVRSQVVGRLTGILPALDFVTAIHPSAQIGSDVQVGAGTVLMAGVVINPGVRIGTHCIVNTKASVDHDSVMEDYSSLGPGATTGGNVVLGQFSVLAQGAQLLHGLRIGSHAVVGAGATVLHDVPASTISYGVPAKIVRSRQIGERYL